MVERSRLPMKDPNDWTTVTAPFIIRKKAPFTLGATTQQLAADGTALHATGLEGEVARLPVAPNVCWATTRSTRWRAH